MKLTSLVQNCSFYNSYLFSVGNICEKLITFIFLYRSWKKERIKWTLSEDIRHEAWSLLCLTETPHLALIVVCSSFTAPRAFKYISGLKIFKLIDRLRDKQENRDKDSQFSYH